MESLFEQLSLPWRRRYAALLSEYGYDASEMPFDPPPESEWSPTADDLAPGADIHPPVTRPSTRPAP